jgi:hypothetical protein
MPAFYRNNLFPVVITCNLSDLNASPDRLATVEPVAGSNDMQEPVGRGMNH